MRKVLYFDCLAGISGDMTIGALLDLGIDRVEFLGNLKKIGIDGYRIEIKEKEVNNISGTDFDVIIENEKPHCQHHNGQHHVHSRNLYDIESIIDRSDIDGTAKTMAKKTFGIIAAAEAEVHNKTLEEVHFHEVGAIDSIVDIVGTAICISMLKVDAIYSSPLHLGTGFVECAHGTLPVPAPATVTILKNVPVYSTGVEGELVTPTGAGIIKSLATDFIPLPSMTIDKVGYGTGKKQYDIFNALRVFLGNQEIVGGLESDKLIMLETNIDDMNPETYSYLVPLLLENGALDVFLTSIVMKKGRPGTLLSVLCGIDDHSKFQNIVFNETTTLGIRKYIVERNCLDRKIVTVKSQFGNVKVKAAYRDGKLLKVAPEYEECQRIARERQIPLKQVYDTLVIETAETPSPTA